MDIRINTESDIPIRRQLSEQIVFLIATETLKTGQALPSVRELARRLKIHHNTVSEAYQDLVRRKWLVRHRGSRLTVTDREPSMFPGEALSLDDLINETIRTARTMGYSLQALRTRVRERLTIEPPDHLLVVEQEEGLRHLMREELRKALPWPVEGCSREELAANHGLIIGALAVTTQHAIREVDVLFPKDRPVVPVAYCAADEHVERIRKLARPSTIAVVSVSEAFLKVARGLLAPAIGRKHSLREILIPNENPTAARGADIVFCDSVAQPKVASARTVPYRLLAAESVGYVSAAMKSYQHPLTK